MRPSNEIFVGTAQRLDGVARGNWPKPYVRVNFTDDDSHHVETMTATTARLLSKALKQNADLIDPPKPRKRRA